LDFDCPVAFYRFMGKAEHTRWKYKLEIESKRNIRYIIIMGGLIILVALIVSIT